MPKVIGITGTIGSGKSAVGEILTSMGVPVIDTDRIVHQLLTDDGPVRTAVIQRFGREVLHSDESGTIDRQKLGAIVFIDREARRDLEQIVHPAVLLECRRRVREHSSKPVVALLVPLLFEAGIQSEYDQVWTVVADESVIRNRLRQRDRLSDAEINDRLAAQLSQTEKSSRANHTIDNSGTLEETGKQVKLLLDNSI